jgi:ceramide glucosyltransferase
LIWLLLIPLAYQAFAIVAALRYRLVRAAPALREWPGVTVLKPVRGLDDNLEAALRSNIEQDYAGEYEVMLGVHRPDDPALPLLQRLAAEYPERVRLLQTVTDPPNGKVGVLIDLEREARYGVLVISDSDIQVPREYLRRITARLAMPGVKLVTCLYRAAANTAAGKWEALGINTDFMPSALVAPLVGVREFGFGSTLCFRREDLRRIGGLEAVQDYIADDYQLAKRIGGAALSETVVETHLSSPGWMDVWRHQVRWARTIRVSRGDGFLGLPVTHAGLWAVVAVACGYPAWAAALYLTRIAMGLIAGQGSRALAPLIPVWDLYAFCIWLAGLAGKRVHWRDRMLTLSPDGRLTQSGGCRQPGGRVL